MNKSKDAPPVRVIGGGLAGCEAAFWLAKRGLHVSLSEMRIGGGRTPAHQTQDLAELVCSNSLKSIDPVTSSGILKEELKLLGCSLLDLAFETRVPAGGALAVDRRNFSRQLTARLSSLDGVSVAGEEVRSLSPEVPTIIASGPLTSASLAAFLADLLGADNLFFYDAISPVLAADSIDRTRVYETSRYGKGGDDYLNCPMDRGEYERFYEALLTAECSIPREFEKKHLFEACLPVEVIAGRGKDALRFGPLRPVGLNIPGTGRRPFAVVQLRREDIQGSMWNMVGFQTRLKYPEQERVFRMIPGLGESEFLRYGSVHRNTFVNSPGVLTRFFQPRHPGWETVFLAGQLTGVEGYVESIASGLVAALNVSRVLEGKQPVLPPVSTMTGALLTHIGNSDPAGFQPMNVNMGLLPAPGTGRGREKKKLQSGRAIEDMREWVMEVLS